MNRTGLPFIICLLIVGIGAPASAEWESLYTPTSDYVFTAVHFPGRGSVGFMVGHGGLIFKSIDGGATWTQQSSPVQEDLNDVFVYVNPLGYSAYCWAVGDNGTIIYSDDGGTTWQVHPQSGIIATTDLLSVIHYQDWFTWVFIGGKSGTLLRSGDGGASFEPPTMNPAQSDVNDIDYLSHGLLHTAVAAIDSNGLMYSTDSGDTWTVCAVDYGPYPYARHDVETVRFIDTTEATQCVAAGWGAMEDLQPTIILESDDAGVSWSIADPSYAWNTHGPAWGIASSADPLVGWPKDLLIVGGGDGSAGLAIHGLHYLDLFHPWVPVPAFSGRAILGVSYSTSGGFIVCGQGGLVGRISDDGRFREAITRPSPGGDGWHRLAMAEAGWVCAGGNGHVFRSHVWVPMDTLIVASPECWAPDLHDIDTLYRNQYGGRGIGDPWYVCGDHEYLCRSNDYGMTWEQLQFSPEPGNTFHGMHWFDAENAVLVGRQDSLAAIWKTADGGESLTVVSLGQFESIPRSVSFAPEGSARGVAVGQDNLVLYTTNAGETWLAGSAGGANGGADLMRCQMVSADVAWAVGEGGVIVKTVNGGLTWFSVPSPVTVSLNDVCFITAQYGYVCGDDAAVYRTDDGGGDWQDISPAQLLESGDDVTAIRHWWRDGRVYVGSRLGAILSSPGLVVGVGEPNAIRVVLDQNRPNPFNPRTTIRFDLPAAGQARLAIYDVAGRLVRVLVDGERSAGTHEAVWDGSDQSGRAAPSGSYLARLEAGGKVEVVRMGLVR